VRGLVGALMAAAALAPPKLGFRAQPPAGTTRLGTS
jgi:hypothetical protein